MLVEFNLTLPEKQNVVWIPKEIVETLGRKLKVASNSFAAVVYPEDAELADVVESLRIIIQDLELRSKRKRKRA